MNIGLTNSCSRRCEFCFQKGWFLESPTIPKQEMSVELFKKILEICPDENYNLVGGEPLLYSKLDDILDICLERNIKVSFISNISVPSDILERIFKKYGSIILGVLINSHYPQEQEELFYKNFHILLDNGIPFQVSVNILFDEKERRQATDRINKILSMFPNKKPSIRVSTVLPTIGEKYNFVDYTEEIINFMVEIRQKHGMVAFNFDCAPSACELHSLFIQKLPNGVTLDIDPCIEPLFDVAPDGKVYWCSSANFLSLPDITVYKSSREIVCALKDKWVEYWHTHSLQCDYKNCGSLNPAVCLGVCVAKNHALEQANLKVSEE